MIYLVAGEASGDLHGSNLIKAMLAINPDLELRFCGGDLMQAAGGTLVQHYKNRAFMGFTEVIKNLGTIRKAIKEVQKDIIASKPEKIVLIDNPGFNMRIAKFAHKHGIPVHYYIAPKVWAWNTGRVKKLKALVKKLYSILPFEPAFFAKHGLKVEYVGNPVIDAIRHTEMQRPHEIPLGKKVVALLPGSRPPEIEKMLPVMLEVADKNLDLLFVIAVAPNFNLNDFKQYEKDNVIAIKDKTYNILSAAQAAIVTSGTATLETAVLGVPQFVCYRVSGLTYAIGKQLIKVPYISLVNLILNKPAVKELIQDECNATKINEELLRLLSPVGAAQTKADYKQLEDLLGDKNASEAVAMQILNNSKNK